MAQGASTLLWEIGQYIGAAMTSVVVFYGIGILIKRQGVDAGLSASLSLIISILFVLLVRSHTTGIESGLSQNVPWILLFYSVQWWRLRRGGESEEDKECEEDEEDDRIGLPDRRRR